MFYRSDIYTRGSQPHCYGFSGAISIVCFDLVSAPVLSLICYLPVCSSVFNAKSLKLYLCVFKPWLWVRPLPDHYIARPLPDYCLNWIVCQPLQWKYRVPAFALVSATWTYPCLFFLALEFDHRSSCYIAGKITAWDSISWFNWIEFKLKLELFCYPPLNRHLRSAMISHLANVGNY